MIAVFASRTTLNSVLPLPSVMIGEPALSLDGRVAISHDFTVDDLFILTKSGAVILDKLPADWQYPVVM